MSDQRLRVCIHVATRFMYGHYGDVEVVAGRMDLDPGFRRIEIRHHITGWHLSPEQAANAKYAGATEVSRAEMDDFFHPRLAEV